MEGNAIWELFMDTGSPEAYILYRRYCQRLEKEKQEAFRPKETFR